MRWTIAVGLAIFFALGGYDPQDVKEAFIYYGEIILPSNIGFGIVLFSILLLLALFLDYETYLTYKEVKKKIKLRKNF